MTLKLYKYYKHKSITNFHGLVLCFIFIFKNIQLIEMNLFSNFCKCEGPQEFPIISCKNISNEQILGEVLSEPFYIEEFGKFSLLDSDIESIENWVMPRDKRFEFISIKKTRLHTISPDLFHSSQILKRLEIIHNNLETLPFDQKLNFPKLEHLDLYYNSLTTIPDYAFGKLLELKTIDLSLNEISYIGSYAFYLNDKLVFLDLRFNKLKVVNNHAFALKRPNIRLSLELTNNNMFYMSEGAFERQSPALLNLSVNSLTKFPEKHFMPILRAMILHNKGGIVVNSK